MAEFFNHRVLPSVWPGQEVTAVAIEDMTYEAGNQCEVLYALQFDAPPRDQGQWAVVTFATANRLQEIYWRHYRGGGDAAARPTSSPVMFLPEYGCLVEFFPMDWGLPSLAWAVEPGEMTSLLFQGGLEAERSRRLPKVEVLRYRLKERRCVLRYVVDVPGSNNPKEVIGNVYNSGPLAVQVASTHNILHPQAVACGLIIPKPLRVVKEWGLLLMERVPGTVVGSLVKQTRAPEQFKEVIGQAAATLASLHRLHFESQEVQSLQTKVEEFRKRAAPLHLVAPLLAQEIEARLQQIAQLGARSTAVAPCFIHGDFSPDQLLLDKGQLGVIDFDPACLGDPAIDVGNFMAKLYSAAVSGSTGNACRQLATYFLSEYQARLPEHRVADRVHLFLSAALVRRALHEFEMQPYNYGRAGADSVPVLLLQEAAACLSRHYFPTAL